MLAAGSTAIFAIGMLPSSVAPWLQGAMWLTLMELFFVRGGLLAIVGGAEDPFTEQYVALLRRVADLKQRAPTTEPAEYVAEFATVIEGFEALRAPTTELADLNADTIRELHRRLALMKLSPRPSSDTFERMTSEWAEIERRLQRVLKSRSRFWAGWPRLFSGWDV